MQGECIVLVGIRRVVDARQMVAVEHDGDGLVNAIELIEEVCRGLVRALHVLRIGGDDAAFGNGVRRFVHAVEFVLGAVEIWVRGMVLHRDELNVL